MDRVVVRHHRKPRNKMFTPANTQCPIPVSSLEPSRTTYMTYDKGPNQNKTDQWTDHLEAHAATSEQLWTGRTVFRLTPESSIPAIALAQADQEKMRVMEFTARQHRQLLAQARPSTNPQQSKHEQYDIVEVFSPPRFALEGCKLGYNVLSADLCTGWDFRKREQRENIIARDKPKLLVCCPPCTWAGGWWHLNKLNMSKHGPVCS